MKKLSMKDLKSLLVVAQNLEVGNRGLCTHLPAHYFKLRRYFKKWPHFSGSYTYPISVITTRSAEEQYVDVRFTGHQPWVKRYIQKRRSLLRHIIKCVKADIAELRKEELDKRAKRLHKLAGLVERAQHKTYKERSKLK